MPPTTLTTVVKTIFEPTATESQLAAAAVREQGKLGPGTEKSCRRMLVLTGCNSYWPNLEEDTVETLH